MIGLQRKTVRVEEHKTAWRLEFEKTKAAILEKLANESIEIQHIGSTSIKNLAAKPIIDIAIGLEKLTEETIIRMVPKLEELGMKYKGNRFERGGYLFVIEVSEEVISHHIHIVEIGDEQWTNYLNFRDTLRNNPKIANEYAQLKIELAKKYPNNRPMYTNSKDEFVSRINKR